MNKEDRDAIIEEDLGWLRDIKVHELGGKLMLGDAELPYNISHVFHEKEFVEQWLMCFALGNACGINYFRAQDWFAISNNGTRAVMVVDDNLKPLVIIPPLLTHQLTPKDLAILRAASMHIYASSQDTMRQNDPNANLGVAREIIKSQKEAKRLTYQEMLPKEFFERHSIIPAVEQKVYYIKDQLHKGKLPVETLNKVRVLLYTHHKGEQVTKEDREFLNSVSLGELDFARTDAKEAAADESKPVQPPNPMEC